MTRLMTGRSVRATSARSRLARIATAVGLAMLVAAGCDVHGISDAGTLSIMSVSPNPQTLVVNATQQFTARGTDFAGVDVPVTPVWSVVTGGGTISTTGLFTASAVPGTFT